LIIIVESNKLYSRGIGAGEKVLGVEVDESDRRALSGRM
jgi:hypothetical protein